jgi:hypothetical protein
MFYQYFLYFQNTTEFTVHAKFHFIYARKKGTAFSRPICVKLTNIHQCYQCVYHLYRILPKSDDKCGKYGRKLIYTHNQSLALTAPIFYETRVAQ